MDENSVLKKEKTECDLRDLASMSSWFFYFLYAVDLLCMPDVCKTSSHVRILDTVPIKFRNSASLLSPSSSHTLRESCNPRHSAMRESPLATWLLVNFYLDYAAPLLLMKMDKNNRSTSSQKPARSFASKASIKQKINPKETKKPLKRQMRDAERLLRNPKLQDNIRQEKELLIEKLSSQLKQNKSKLKAAKYAKKYKKVKFFEKKKLTRRYLSLRKKLKNCETEDSGELHEEMKQVEAQLNYVIYFPPDIKYISLFPSKPGQDDKVNAKKDEIFEQISEDVTNGKLPGYSNLLNTDPKRNKRQAKRLTNKGSNSKQEDEFFIVDRMPDEDIIDG
ncbi:rRNA-processing protein EFG1 [Trichoplax sp. H2]|nr:rRNA-processing protein EFG1 [Trichoplax sp. H2]|eukprot:RDD41836.1 rRNA-processing protein EFG1 [Trichoplax sp. H2]